METKTVVKVVVSSVKGGFCYTAHLADGSTEVVRAKATTLYPKAFYYSYDVATGNKRGLARRFSYGKAPNHHGKDRVIATFTVEGFEEELAKLDASR